jgi:hypothetical protein
MRLIFCLILFELFGCSCTTTPRLDPQSSVSANDLTALVSGCGQQVTVGYLVCRMSEGSAADENIYIHAPPNLKCDDDKACVFFKIFFPDGRPTYEGVVKRGESYASVSWSEITNKKTFDPGDRGFYGVSITINYKGPDGMPLKTYADGYVFFHVVKKEYISLTENEEDESYVWKWKAPTNQTIKMTTGSRVYVSPPILSPGSILDGSKL